MEGFLVVAAFLVLFMLGFPVVLAIGIPCFVYIFANGLPIDLVAQRTLYALDSFPLVAVPVFLFVGSLMNSAGISRYIYQFADTATGRLPGGLAQVNIFGSLIFAGMSGSALADIGGLGRIEIDAMRKKGFSAPFAAAVTSSSAIVGPIFPPSIPLIIYGTVTGVSVIQLLLGGIVPGLLCVAMLMLMTAWLARRRNYPRAEVTFSKGLVTDWKTLPRPPATRALPRCRLLRTRSSWRNARISMPTATISTSLRDKTAIIRPPHSKGKWVCSDTTAKPPIYSWIATLKLEAGTALRRNCHVRARAS